MGSIVGRIAARGIQCSQSSILDIRFRENARLWEKEGFVSDMLDSASRCRVERVTDRPRVEGGRIRFAPYIPEVKILNV